MSGLSETHHTLHKQTKKQTNVSALSAYQWEIHRLRNKFKTDVVVVVIAACFAWSLAFFPFL